MKKRSLINRIRDELEFHGAAGVTVEATAFGRLYEFELDGKDIAMMMRSKKKGLRLVMGSSSLRFAYNDIAQACKYIAENKP